jgi:integrase
MKRRRKIPVVVECGIPIREIRPDYHMIDFRRGGKRDRCCFTDLPKAKEYARRLSIKVANEGLTSLDLSAEDRLDAARALRILKGDATLQKAAEDYIRRHPQRNAEPLKWTAWRYLRFMCKHGRRPLSIRGARDRFRVICRDLGDHPAAGLTSQDGERWADHRGYHGTNRKNYLRAFNSLLNFHAGTLRKQTTTDEELPVVWPVRTVEKVFLTAQKIAPDALPGLTVLWFCGLRPYEAYRLPWTAVSLAEGTIEISPQITKRRSARSVTIPANAKRWLTGCQRSGQLVCVSLSIFRHRREQIMREAGIDSWPQDVSRHTFATAHYNAHEDVGKTCRELGHFGNPQTFVQHYKGQMTRKESLRYWEIRPKNRAKVIPMVAEAS